MHTKILLLNASVYINKDKPLAEVPELNEWLQDGWNVERMTGAGESYLIELSKIDRTNANNFI